MFRQHREMAPLVHDLLHEFGWLTDSAINQSLALSGDFPKEEGSSLSVRQSRVAPTDPQPLVRRTSPYERTIECKRTGLVEGRTHGSALSGRLIEVSCSILATGSPGEVTNVFVWVPSARVFLLVKSQQPGKLGGVEVQTRHIEALSISP